MADALSKVDQGGEGAKALESTTKTLTTRKMMTNESKKVRVLTALCAVSYTHLTLPTKA